MSKPLEKIMQEWERTLLVCVLLALLAVLGVAAYFVLREHEGAVAANTPLPKMPAYFDTSNTNFLNPAGMADGTNPLAFVSKVSVLPPEQKPESRPNTTRPTKQPTPTPTTKKTDPPKKDPPKKQEPKKPARKINITYRGFISNGNKQVAFYSANDTTKGAKPESGVADTGKKIYKILDIKEFNADSMVLEYKGKKHTFQKGVKKEITIQ